MTSFQNTPRLAKLIAEACRRLKLDLQGMRVLTEAGSNAFCATPVIAAYAGAQVVAVTKTTAYGSAEEIASQVVELARFMGVDGKIVLTSREAVPVEPCYDIVTNLGHLRPLDAAFLSRFDPRRMVIPTMSELWELRPGDVDLAYCRQQGIPVAGTNEMHPDVDCFRTVGTLAAKLLLERGFQLRNEAYLVIGHDAFGRVIADYLRACGAHIELVHPQQAGQTDLASYAALVVADYTWPHLIIGPGGSLDPQAIAVEKGLEVIQVAGANDVASCDALGVPVYPHMHLPPRRMSFTLAHVGAKPVIDLHAGGLKVGELLKRGTASDLVQLYTGTEAHASF